MRSRWSFRPSSLCWWRVFDALHWARRRSTPQLDLSSVQHTWPRSQCEHTSTIAVQCAQPNIRSDSGCRRALSRTCTRPIIVGFILRVLSPCHRRQPGGADTKRPGL